jgi:subtilisin family serine protease
VAAGGNDSSRGEKNEYVISASPLGASEGVIAVGSLDPSLDGRGYRVSGFSNCGVDLTAPGRGIVSAAAGGGTKAQSGTSAAAPHVAGVAALWWQAVRQAGLPANAALVRRKLIECAQGKGFSAVDYPADRGAGCAFAPQDGLAVTEARAADRSDDARWPDDTRILDVGLPIAIDLGLNRTAHHGGRRNLC